MRVFAVGILEAAGPEHSAPNLMARVPVHWLGLIEAGADVGAAVPASLAGKLRLEIGQPDVIRPSVCADRDRMAAAIIRAIDQQAARARRAHFPKGDLLRAGGHALIEAWHGPIGKLSIP